MMAHYLLRSISTRTYALLAGCVIATSVLIGTPVAHAEVCTAPGTDNGTVTLMTSIGVAGTYHVWTRMAAPNSTDNSYMLQVDSAGCYTIGGTGVPTYVNGATDRFLTSTKNWIHATTDSAPVDITLGAGAHTLKLIGVAAGVTVDKLLLTADSTCTPLGLGTNCASAYLAPDINTDAKVNFRDFSQLAAKYTQTGSSLGRVDINSDGVVDILDYSALASVYGSTGANMYTSLEAESGTTSGNVAAVGDSTAAGSTAVAFGTTVVANCVGNANTPGGPDPWGGCWPGPQNTGYPHGLSGDTRTPVTLTNYTGPTTITSCGVVIDSKTVNDTIIVNTGNGTHSADTPCVTIKNSLVKGVIYAETTDDGPVIVQDTEVVPPDLPWWENIGRNNMFVYRVNSHGGEGVIKCGSNCEAKDNWVHGMELGGQYHYNAVGGNQADGFVIEHNYLTCGDWAIIDSDAGNDAGCSAVIGFYGDFGPVQNVTINKNYLESSFVTGSQEFRQSGYCLNPGYYTGKPYPAPSNMTITNNIFGRGLSGKCAVYGPTNSLNAVGAQNGNVWSGNMYTDGTIINRVEE